MQNFKIVTFNSTINYGQMSLKFINKDLPREERLSILHDNKEKFIKKIGLNYKNIFIANQKNMKTSDLYEDGYCFELTPDHIKEYDDLYNLNVYADITKISSNIRNVAIAFPAADCAIMKAVNMKTNEIVLSHCGGEYIDRYLPMQTIDALGGSEKDINIYVSPFAHKLFYLDINNLAWANNPSVWVGCKDEASTELGTSVTIDIRKALKKQLIERKIPENNIFMSSFDTVNSNLFYSNAKSHYDDTYSGRFLSGIAIVSDTSEIETNRLIKIIK